MRIGHGFDIHPLAEGRRLMLGGVEVPSQFGSVGHSDADAVLHALADALLGALALGDIGEWFPDTDPAFKNADSARLVKTVLAEVTRLGAAVENVDVTVYLEKPKLGALKSKIRSSIAAVLGVDVTRVAVKARTFEGFGAIGRGQAVAATAVVLLDSPPGGKP